MIQMIKKISEKESDKTTKSMWQRVGVIKSITVLSTILLFGACGNQMKNDESLKNKVVIAHDSDITSLTPLTHNLVSSARFDEIVYNKLFKYGEKGEIVPVLAKGYKYLDENTIEIELKEGIKFHNGEELTANDVAATFKFWREAKIRAHMIEAVDTVVAKDKYTVVIKTKYPFAPLMGNIVAMGHMLNEKNITTNPNFKSEPIGTGPYKFVSWAPGDNFTVEAFDDYFEGKPEVKTIVFKTVPEGSARTMGLESGDYNVVIDLEPIDKQLISKNEKLKYEEIPAARSTFIFFNTQKDEYANRDVRAAIEYAVDKEAMIQVVLEGNGLVANTMIAPQILGASKNIQSKKQDYEKAKELLAKAGYPEGFKTVLTTTNRAPYNKMTEILQENLKEIGIEATIESYDWAAFLERTGKGLYDISIVGWSNSTGDPDYSIYPLLHTKSAGAAGNRGYYMNPELDDLLDQGRRVIDVNKRLEIYEKVQQLLAHEVPVIPVFFGTANIAKDANIEGIRLDATSRHDFKYMKIKK